MSDLKSKLPDLNELSTMAGKLFADLKKSVNEIIDTYKSKHDTMCADAQCTETKPKKKAEKKAPVDKAE